MDFQAFVNDIRANQWPVFGVEVYRHGSLLHAYGDTAQTPHPIYSATKTLLSIGVGIACDEGKLNPARSILLHLPKRFWEELPRAQLLALEQITLERLLTMSVAGFPFRPEGESFLRFALQCPIDPSLRVFNYSNISAYLVGVALTHAVHEDAYAFLSRRVFEPLHIVNPAYQRCPDGYFYGASGMQLTVRQLSQTGLLLYNGGLCEGQRIVSQTYVQKATSVRQMNREDGYGYFIWKYRDGFCISGKWGQKCYILPQDGLVVTWLSHMEHHPDALLRSMETHLLALPQQDDPTQAQNGR